MFYPYTHRDVFAHTGNQLAAVTTTIDNTDPAGYVSTTDTATGEAHGQIALTTRSTSGATAGIGQCSHTTGEHPLQHQPTPPQNGPSPGVDATLYALECDLAGAPQELINTTTSPLEGTRNPTPLRQTHLDRNTHQPTTIRWTIRGC